jgi:serine/threonine protein kinase
VLGLGDVIDGKYRVVRLLGKGGMGAVYEARNLRIDKRVALKVMRADLRTDRALVRRFEREARAAAKVRSSHVVDVFDLGDLPDGDHFIAMEFLEGESLWDRLQREGPLSPEDLAPIATQLLDGLAEVHAAKIVHRDLKPGNIFLARASDGGELVKILDFGVCKLQTPTRSEVSTGVGNILGSLGYLCPEHLEHGPKALDGRADLYAVGVILYRCASGVLPYRASTVSELVAKLREGRAPPLTEVVQGIDASFSAIVAKAIDWDPKARYQSAAEFRRALDGWRTERQRLGALLGDYLGRSAAKKERGAKGPPRPRRSSKTMQAVLAPPEASGEIDVEVSLPQPGPATGHGRKKGGTVRMRDAPERDDEIEVDVELDDPITPVTVPRGRPRTRR